MQNALNTEVMIEAMVDAACPEDASSREKHIYRQMLMSLVRLAKSEHAAEMKKHAERLVSVETPAAIEMAA
ncbi:hypothetical protein [Noviherbaspirillum massiliense]|uniref:hypothetical protein n=1 Tax=Noviherbaspirillum massiliense TaxID=1465823 RepID=UPI0003122921|nr:hypothetical protein [Noviherbaspirillum massiliense]